MAELAGVSRKTQGFYEDGTRHPDTKYLAAILAHGADVPFIVTGHRSGSRLPAEEQRLLELFRQAGSEEQGMILRMVAAAIGATVEAAPKASQLLPAQEILIEMFSAMLTGVPLTGGKEAIARELAEGLAENLELAELDWEIHPMDAAEQQDDPHDEMPARKRA